MVDFIIENESKGYKPPVKKTITLDKIMKEFKIGEINYLIMILYIL
jgi:hypothetical protein